MNPTWILLVEDDPDHEALALRALRKSNIQADVVVARNGLEALAILSKEDLGGHPGLPRVVFLDLKLPVINGFEVLRRIRIEQRTAMVPVVVLTSSDEDGDKCESYNLGANSYIQKPVDYDRFVEVIRDMGSYWLALNHVASGR